MSLSPKQIPFELPIMDETERSSYVGDLFGTVDLAINKGLDKWLEEKRGPKTQAKGKGSAREGDAVGDRSPEQGEEPGNEPNQEKVLDEELTDDLPFAEKAAVHMVRVRTLARPVEVDRNSKRNHLLNEEDPDSQPQRELERKAFLHFQDFLPRNPRLLKQMVNHYRLVALLMRRGDLEDQEKTRLEVFKLAKWVIFLYVFPEKALSLTKTLQGANTEGDVFALLDEPSTSNVNRVSESEIQAPEVVATKQFDELFWSWSKFRETFPEMTNTDVQAFRRYLRTV